MRGSARARPSRRAVIVFDGAVLGLNSLATRNLDAWTVYGGVPARVIKSREHAHGS